MRLYLVRHGESEVNAKSKIHQAPDSHLTPDGKKQSHLLGKYLSEFSIDVFYTSPLPRAEETADIIKTYIKLPPQKLKLLEERKNPSILFGRSYDDPKALEIKKQLSENYSNPDFRHSDEETFFDLKRRVVNLIQCIKITKKNNILLLSHGHIMVFIIGMLMSRYNLQPHSYHKLDNDIHFDNVSVTICEEYPLYNWNFPIFNYSSFLEEKLLHIEPNK